MAFYPFKTGQKIWVNNLPYWFLHQEYSITGNYCDRLVCLKDNPFTQVIALFYRLLEWLREPIMEYEAQRLNVKDGEPFPKWSIIWFLAQIYFLSNRFAVKIDRELY